MSNPFDRNPYRLPPPWDPGYALPQNVDDEGLARRAYTTAWTRRGTFDNPKVGTAGYAVPQYIKDEQYGTGAMVTRWAPRGSYPGPRIPHWLDKQSAKVVGRIALPGGATKLQIQTMAGIEAEKTGGEAPFTNYGLASSAALVETVKMMPPAIREQQLREALDRIDPKLYSRGEKLATAESKAGVPATIALERGLAAAMSQGMASELVDLGKGKRPGKRTQLGGCMSCMALLGDYPPVRTGYCWVPATATVPAHWERARATGCTYPQTGVTASGGPTTRTGSSGGGVTVTTTTGQVVTTPPPRPAPEPPSSQRFVKIGPFLIPTNVGAWRDHRPLSADKKSWVDANVAQAAKAGGVSIAEMQTGRYPFVRFKSDTNEAWGLFYTLAGDGSTTIVYHKMTDKGLSGLGGLWSSVVDIVTWPANVVWDVMKKIWAGIKWVAAKVVDFVKDAAEWIKDKACDLFTSPVGQIAGAAAGAYVGGPTGAQAGAMGAQIAAQACSSPQPTPETPPPPPAPSSNLMPLLLLGGAGVAAVLILGRKK